jgi:hypothetical protein
MSLDLKCIQDLLAKAATLRLCKDLHPLSLKGNAAVTIVLLTVIRQTSGRCHMPTMGKQRISHTSVETVSFLSYPFLSGFFSEVSVRKSEQSRKGNERHQSSFFVVIRLFSEFPVASRRLLAFLPADLVLS